MMGRFLTAVAACALTVASWGPVAQAADTNADASFVLQNPSSVKGLIVRAPAGDAGEANLSAAEYRLDTAGATTAEALPAAFGKAFDVKGYGEVAKKAGDSTDASTGYYYYNYYNYYWTFTYTYTYTYYYVGYVYYYYPIYYYYY